MLFFKHNQIIGFKYTNWKGITSNRKAQISHIWFGSTPYHPEPQWFLTALDVEKMETRDFALNDIHDYTHLEI